MKRTVTVRPRKVGGAPLTVRDRDGRAIKYKENGIAVPMNTFISRRIKEGDLDYKVSGHFENKAFPIKKQGKSTGGSK